MKIKYSIILIVVFIIGYEAHKAKLFPLNRFFSEIYSNNLKEEEEKGPPITSQINQNLSNKTMITCPSQEESIIIVTFGQSNSANHTSQITSSNSEQILNFYKGKCYIAADPLLGATGRGGSVWVNTLLKINKGQKKIVLISFGLAGTSINDWLVDLKDFYSKNVDSFKFFYPDPNFIIWFQGEANRTSKPRNFKKDLENLVQMIKKDFLRTRLIITGTTYCKGSYSKEIKDIQLLVSKKYDLLFLTPINLRVKNIDLMIVIFHFLE